jgi:hypothetical protein
MHFGSPTHPMTLELLARELTVIASTVPVTEPQLPPPPPPGEEAPTPRPVKARAVARKDGWDFLKPVARLSKWPAEAVGEQPSPPQPPAEYPVSK